VFHVVASRAIRLKPAAVSETLKEKWGKSLSTPRLGRNARLFKDGVVIGYAKDISVKASADLFKEYSMGSVWKEKHSRTRVFTLKEASA
jgi:hypothetical protein